MVGDFKAAAKHVRGIIAMVELSDRAQTRKLNDFLHHLLYRFVYEQKILEENPEPPCKDVLSGMRSSKAPDWPHCSDITER